jgi:hypothetical protein
MRLKLVPAAVVAALAISLLGATGASAATQFGDTCAGNAPAPNYTLTTLTKPAGGMPLTAPVGGVITKLTLNNQLPPGPTLSQMVKVLRPAGGNNFTAVAQTLIQTSLGTTVADVRLPVQPGDRLGVHGEPTPLFPEGMTVYCNAPGSGSRLGAKTGDVPVGTTAEFLDVAEGGVPIVGLIEPDADNDGFGDETQDKCPQSAALQTPCPLITLGAVGKAGKGSTVVLVSVSTDSPVTVKGTVKLGKGKNATLTAPAKAVAPGQLGRFTLKYPASLKSKLKELEPKKKLTLKINASAANVLGLISQDELKIKLKGQG